MDGYNLTGKSENKSARGRYQKRKESIAFYIFQNTLNEYILEQNIFIDYILKLSKAI